MSINDQYNMGRIPLRPLALSDKALAQTKELIIDYKGDNPTYHIYITDTKDRTKLIDITQLILDEAFPIINADNFKISIEGIMDAQSLRDIINYIYKRFLMPENANGFNYANDWKKLYDPLTKSILMKDTDNIIYLPVTTADNIYDANGTTLQDRLDNMIRVGFATDFVRATTQSQTSFKIEYPFPDYSAGGNYIEVKIGSTYIDPSRYEIIDEVSSDGHVYGATLNLVNEGLEKGRAINFLFIYNSADTSNGLNEYLYGGLIANNSIPINKMQKSSDRYDLADSTSVATSKALYNLYKFCCEALGTTPASKPATTPGNYKISTNRYVYTIKNDKENTIGYSGLMYNTGEDHNIFVYRNGVRLFESIDYSIDTSKKTITVYVNTEQYEKFVFEYYSVEGK